MKLFTVLKNEIHINSRELAEFTGLSNPRIVSLIEDGTGEDPIFFGENFSHRLSDNSYDMTKKGVLFLLMTFPNSIAYNKKREFLDRLSALEKLIIDRAVDNALIYKESINTLLASGRN